MKLPLYKLIFFLLLLSFQNKLFAKSILLTDKTEKVALYKGSSYIEDKEKIKSIDIISKSNSWSSIKSDGKIPVWGLTKSRYWIKLTLENKSQLKKWVLASNWPQLDKIEIYKKGLDGRLKKSIIGRQFYFSQRDIQYRQPNIIIDVPLNKKTVFFISIENENSVGMPLYLYTHKSFSTMKINNTLFIGIYYGALVVLLIYNALLFLYLKDKVYLAYISYIFTFIFLQLNINGLAFQLFWPEAPYFNKFFDVLILNLTIICGVFFTKLFFPQRSIKLIIRRTSSFLIYTGLFNIISYFIFSYKFSLQSSFILSPLFFIYLILVGLNGLKSKFEPAKYYLLAILFLVLGGFCLLLSNLGVLPNNTLTEYSLQIGSSFEMIILSLAMSYKVRVLKEAQIKTMEEKKRFKLISQMARQVSHDIRSPLTALDMATSKLENIPEENRIIIKGAVQGIKDIANGLLKVKEDEKESNSSNIETSSELISPLIESILTEKRAQFRNKIDIDIISDLDPDSYGLFSKMNRVEFRRVLSNLINNAVEAFQTIGNVKIGLTKSHNKAQITVEDNGKGIPEDIKEQLFERGKTFGKENGHGLGLYHAKETIESWGGAISINSEVGKGTKITIELPLSEPNSWFLSSITLKPETKIIVLDDDPSIHQVWKERFRPLNYQIISFSEPSSFKSHIKGLPNLDNTLILSDYELIGYSETGIDLIRELDIAENCILVTSHYDESRIIESCKGLNLRLVPKSMAGIVPISVTEASKFDLVYMDDDKYLRMAWELKAKKQNKKILSVGEFSNLESNLSNIDLETPFFLDRDLGEDLPKGEDIAKDLFEKGFKNLYLCTGYRKEDLQEFPWIKEILPKNVDFENYLL